MSKKPEDHEDGSDEFTLDEEFKQIVKQEKQDMLLANRRARVTTMSFHDWFVQTYQRDFKQSDKAIYEAYNAGAADEIENNEYILEHADLKMNHYKRRSVKLADQMQILYSLLGTIERKGDVPDSIKKLIRRILSEQD